MYFLNKGALERKELLVREVVIPQLHPDLWENVGEATRFGARVMGGSSAPWSRTVKVSHLDARTLLLVDQLDLEGKETGAYDIAVDTVQAGVATPSS